MQVREASYLLEGTRQGWLFPGRAAGAQGSDGWPHGSRSTSCVGTLRPLVFFLLNPLSDVPEHAPRSQDGAKRSPQRSSQPAPSVGRLGPGGNGRSA